MARCGFAGTINRFIELCDSNEIAGLIRDQISPNMRTDNNEFGSWRDGLLKLSNDLTLCIREQPMIGELHIALELTFDNQSRADVVICGTDETGCGVFFVLELKQWSQETIEESLKQGMLRALVGGSRVEEVHHPSLQAQAYARSIQSSNACENSRFISGSYLPNMVQNPIIRSPLESLNDSHMILINQSDILLSILNSNFSLGNPSTSSLDTLLRNEFVFSSEVVFVEEGEIDEEPDNDDIFVPEQERGRFGYLGRKDEFIEDCERNLIAGKIREGLGISMRETTSEFRSWREGLSRLAILLRDVECNLEVACEVSSQAGMIDVILFGRGREEFEVFVVEIKQWSEPGILAAIDEEYIRANTGGIHVGLTLHPLVQAHRYLRGMRNYNMYFEENNPNLHCVAFLPNVMSPEECAISDSRYRIDEGVSVYGSSTQDFVDLLNDRIVDTAPPGELEKMISSPPGLTRYITEQIKAMIENHEESLVPSGEQQRAIDQIVSSIEENSSRQVHIIQGGPGTGKTIVGLFSMLRYHDTGQVISFIAGNNPTPRVLRRRIKDIVGNSDFNEIVMTGGQLRVKLRNLQFDQIDILLVDEAQSLKWTGMGQPPRIEDLLEISDIAIFMLDERQSDDPRERVNVQYIEEEVQKAALEFGEDFSLVKHTLEIQQRAGALSNFLPWIGRLLGYGDNPVAPLNFPITIYDSASDLRHAVLEQNSKEGIEGALTASYCWEFLSKDDPEEYDIVLDRGDFRARWNKQGGTVAGNAYLIDPTRDERVGYPPELRGQELDHTGVILGPDLRIVDGELTILPEHQAPDSHCFGIAGRGKTPAEKFEFQRRRKKSLIEEDREKYVDLVRNQYWIILTRATKHLHLYSEDEEVRNFISDYLDNARE